MRRGRTTPGVIFRDGRKIRTLSSRGRNVKRPVDAMPDPGRGAASPPSPIRDGDDDPSHAAPPGYLARNAISSHSMQIHIGFVSPIADASRPRRSRLGNACRTSPPPGILPGWQDWLRSARDDPGIEAWRPAILAGGFVRSAITASLPGWSGRSLEPCVSGDTIGCMCVPLGQNPLGSPGPLRTELPKMRNHGIPPHEYAWELSKCKSRGLGARVTLDGLGQAS